MAQRNFPPRPQEKTQQHNKRVEKEREKKGGLGNKKKESKSCCAENEV